MPTIRGQTRAVQAETPSPGSKASSSPIGTSRAVPSNSWLLQSVLALLFVGLLTYACNLVNIAIMTPCASFDLPSQHGKTFLITGASSGLGLETARVLALKGGKVIMGCRSRHKCEEAKKQAQIASLDVHCEDVELSSQASVRSFAAVRRGQQR